MRPARLLVAALCLLAAPTADAATTSATSSNWAGYAAHRAGVKFRKVSGAWTVPTVDCSSQGTAWSATWVGLGGYSARSQALEQTGTEADCDSQGNASYTSWYELVPAASRIIRLTTRAGDRMTASVTVTGHRVRIRLSNLTRHTTFLKTLTAASVDVTSAEWIVEAPSSCTSDNTARCRVMRLANFGTTTLDSAGAITTGGHAGRIVDPLWNTTAITLSGDSGNARAPWDGPPGPGGAPTQTATSSANATIGALNASASAFTVTFSA